MLVIPGATRDNNRVMDGVAQIDPETQVTETRGVTMRADVEVSGVKIISEPNGNAMFDKVSFIFNGHINALRCSNFPGMGSESVEIRFSKPQVFDDEDMIQTSKKDAPKFALNTDRPEVKLRYMPTLTQLFKLGAIGGFVDRDEADGGQSFLDDANDALSTIVSGRTLEMIPVDVNVVEDRRGNSSLYLIDIVNQYDIPFVKENSGYDFVDMIPVAPEMQNDADRVFDRSDEIVAQAPEIEHISRADMVNEALVDFDLGVEEEPVAEQVAESKPAPFVHEPFETYNAGKHMAEMDDDAKSVMDILASIRGTGETPVAKQPEVEAETPAQERQQAQTMDFDLNLGDFDFSKPAPRVEKEQSEPSVEDTGFDWSSIAVPSENETGGVDLGNEQQDEKATIPTADATVRISGDELLEDMSKDEAEHRESIERSVDTAKMDMANDGAKTIAEAQANKPRDNRFDNDYVM